MIMDKSDTPRTEHVLSDAGVFKGHEGLRQLAECENFWQQRPYGTRLYFDEEYPGRYLHRSVLRAAIQAMDSFAEQKNTIEREVTAVTSQLAEARSIAWEWGQGVDDAEAAIRKLSRMFPIDAMKEPK